MKINVLKRIILIGLTLTFAAGCTSTPVANDPAAFDSVFQQPIEKVQIAAVDALVVTGFDLKKQELKYVEGFRPRKIGLIVGSGGETVGIWLTEQGTNKTSVKIDTAKSFVGIIGQKNWNAEIMNEMTRNLAK